MPINEYFDNKRRTGGMTTEEVQALDLIEAERRHVIHSYGIVGAHIGRRLGGLVGLLLWPFITTFLIVRWLANSLLNLFVLLVAAGLVAFALYFMWLIITT